MARPSRRSLITVPSLLQALALSSAAAMKDGADAALKAIEAAKKLVK
jgi:hypothetical protein